LQPISETFQLDLQIDEATKKKDEDSRNFLQPHPARIPSPTATRIGLRIIPDDESAPVEPDTRVSVGQNRKVESDFFGYTSLHRTVLDLVAKKKAN